MPRGCLVALRGQKRGNERIGIREGTSRLRHVADGHGRLWWRLHVLAPDTCKVRQKTPRKKYSRAQDAAKGHPKRLDLGTTASHSRTPAAASKNSPSCLNHCVLLTNGQVVETRSVTLYAAAG